MLEYFAEGEYYLNYKNIPHVHPADNIPVASEFKPFFKAPLAFFIPWIGVTFEFLTTYSAINYWLFINLAVVLVHTLYKGWRAGQGLKTIKPFLQILVSFLTLLYFFNLWLLYHEMQNSIIGLGPVTTFPFPEERMLVNVRGRPYKKSEFIRNSQDISSWWF